MGMPSHLERQNLLIGPEGVPDFANITPADYEVSFNEAVAAEREVFAKIIADEGPATFANTVAPFLRAGDRVNNIIGGLWSHVMAEGTDALSDLKTRLITDYTLQTAIYMQDPQFAARVQAVADTADTLSDKERYILQKFMHGFTDYGTLQDAAAQTHIKELDAQLTELTEQFMKNLKEARIAQAVYFADAAELDGVNGADLAGFAAQAQEKGHNGGYLVVPERLLVDKLLTECTNSASRKRLYDALTGTGAGAVGATEPVIHAIAEARAERAQACGFTTYADYVLRTRMVSSIDQLDSFLTDMTAHLLPHYAQEVATVTEYAAKHGHAGKLEAWDIDYWTAQYKQDAFQLDMAALEPYLHTDKVVAALLVHIGALYDVSFKTADDLPRTEKGVQPYRVYDATSGELLAVLLVDLYARPESKEGGAWEAEYLNGETDEDTQQARPAVVGLHMNLGAPMPGYPSIIDLRNIETLFHEMGHVMHAILGQNQPFGLIRGTAVQQDFVEMPSQVLENFVNEPDFMAAFLTHADNGAPPPAEALQTLAEYAQFGRAQVLLKLIQNSRYDLAMHTTPERRAGTIAQIMERETISAELSPLVRPYQITRFDHLFSSPGAYAVGYYSYAWSDVLDAQVYGRIKHDKTGLERAKLKETLQAAGSEDATALFTGKFGPIDMKYALARAGVVIGPAGAPLAAANSADGAGAAQTQTGRNARMDFRAF